MADRMPQPTVQEREAAALRAKLRELRVRRAHAETGRDSLVRSLNTAQKFLEAIDADIDGTEERLAELSSG